jgi:hypothetical protein
MRGHRETGSKSPVGESRPAARTSAASRCRNRHNASLSWFAGPPCRYRTQGGKRFCPTGRTVSSNTSPWRRLSRCKEYIGICAMRKIRCVEIEKTPRLGRRVSTCDGRTSIGAIPTSRSIDTRCQAGKYYRTEDYRIRAHFRQAEAVSRQSGMCGAVCVGPDAL